MNVGQNTASGQALAGFVERVETLLGDKKVVSDAVSAVLAEAKAAGFVPGAIRHVIKLRAMKPHARQEAEALVDTYLHALGMASETPLFRTVGLMGVDTASRDSVIEALKKLVPDNGSITVETNGKPVRLTRDKDGNVSVSDVIEPEPLTFREPPRPTPSSIKTQVPDVDADGAEALGRQAFRDNEPIIGNPFPFGDDRRPRWDAGWRLESGGDGMGPGGDD